MSFGLYLSRTSDFFRLRAAVKLLRGPILACDLARLVCTVLNKVVSKLLND